MKYLKEFRNQEPEYFHPDDGSVPEMIIPKYILPLMRNTINELEQCKNIYKSKIEETQKILMEYLLPDSKLNAEQCINEILTILDNRELIEYMNTDKSETGSRASAYSD